MLNYKSYTIIFVCSLLFFTACIESKYNLDINKTFATGTPDFLKTLPGINGATYNKRTISKKADKIDVYRASFSEATIQKNNVLEISALNTSSTIPRVAYREIDGFTQDLYLMKYSFSYFEGSFEVENTAVVFLSLHYRPLDKEPFKYCTGAGPSYWGLVFDDYISFDSVLVIKDVKTNPYLKAMRPNKRYPFNLLFMPVNFVDDPAQNNGALDIKKIVRMDPNKVGGTKPLVFDLPEIFNDSKAMHFIYAGNIILNP